MAYSVKETYYTLQGEGRYAGRPAVFCRFSGCNLWSGLEKDRLKAVCQFCDTDFVGTDGPGGGRFDHASDFAKHLLSFWPERSAKVNPFVVFTGGEPLLQLDKPLVDEMKRHDCIVAIETNGTFQPPPGVDHICVSPKAGAKLELNCGQELKLVYPQPGLSPEIFESMLFEEFYLQPMDGPELKVNTRQAMEYCMKHPKWSVSVQLHKIVGIP